MQKVLIGFFAIATAILSVLCGVLWQQLSAAKQQARSAEFARSTEVEEREAQTARLKELERNEARLERQLQEFSTVTRTLRASEANQSSNLTQMAERIRANSRTGVASAEGEGRVGKGMGEMLGKMMKDPAMREMMREQQKAAINMMYAGLFKDLNMTAEEKDKLRALLTDSQMRNIENAQGLFGGGEKAPGEEARKELETAKKETDEQIKALLGEERFAYFQDYQKNMGERMQLDQFKNQLAGENLPLRDEQSALLLQIMKEEKLARPPVISTDQTEMPKPDTFTAKKVDEQLKWMEEYNQRIADRVRNANVLTPEQLNQWLTFQEQQVSMQKLGLNMARQMFGNGKTTEPAPAK